MKKAKEYTKGILLTMLVVCVLNLTLAIVNDRSNNPQYTETELFNRLPQTLFWDFGPAKN